LEMFDVFWGVACTLGREGKRGSSDDKSSGHRWKK